jgi:chemotaxis protein histidine kinase CheA
MKNKSNKGTILIVVLIIIGLLSGLGSIYEVHKAHEKNTAKAIVQTANNVEVAKQVSDTLVTKNAQDEIARSTLEKAHKDQVQEIAGNAEGAKIALDSDPSPSLQSKIASIMVDNVLDISGPATSQQVAKFTQIIKELAAANSQLAAENNNLKNVNLVTTQSLNSVTVENAQTKANLAIAEKKSSDADAIKNDAIKQVVIANNAAAASAKQIDIINQSWATRFKEYVLGFGVFPLIGICILLPLIGIAFPEALPVIKFITAPFLKLWHVLYAKLIALEQKATAAEVASHAITSTALIAEQAAHAATKSTIQATVTALTTGPIVPPSASTNGMIAPVVKSIVTS